MSLGQFMPFGIVPDASPEVAQLLANPTGRALYSAAQSAATKYYTLHPVGSETQSGLRDRIAAVFAQQFADKWQGPISVDAVGASSNFSQIVTFVSPLSVRNSAAAVAQSDFLRIALIAGGVVAAGFLIYWLTRRKTKVGIKRKMRKLRRR
jgi:hypothetical protein